MSLKMRVNRILQHANIGLDAQDDDDNSLLFPYVMSIVICLIGVLYFLQCCYMYVCRVYCGREPVRSGEEILSELTEDQRKAVMKSILAKLCKVRENLWKLKDNHLVEFSPLRVDRWLFHRPQQTRIFPNRN
jgi:hypothetical protein